MYYCIVKLLSSRVPPERRSNRYSLFPFLLEFLHCLLEPLYSLLVKGGTLACAAYFLLLILTLFLTDSDVVLHSVLNHCHHLAMLSNSSVSNHGRPFTRAREI